MSRAQIVAAIELMLDELAFYRSEDAIALTVVDGELTTITLQYPWARFREE